MEQHAVLDLGCQFQLDRRLFLFSGQFHIFTGITVDLAYHSGNVIRQQTKLVLLPDLAHFRYDGIAVFTLNILIQGFFYFTQRAHR